MAATKHELDHWIRQIGQGDRDALASLYHATSTAVYSYALSILKNCHDAEDALHDCYVTVWQSARNYRSQNKPMAWILTITRNLCFKLLQHQKRFVSLEQVLPVGIEDSDPEAALLLQSSMGVLSDEERQIVVLHAIAGCKHREIAQMLELNLSTVLSKYRRAIQKLKSCL